MPIKFSVACYLVQYVIVANIFVHSIQGGYKISIQEAPYQVNYGDVCGGVLIHRQWALTSAHCGTEFNFIRAGSRYRLKGPKIKIVKHLVHPRYAEKHKFDFDVQLLRILRKLNFGRTISAIPVGEGRSANSIIVSGWGYNKEKGDYTDLLQQVQLAIVPIEKCQAIDNFWYNHTLTERMFCAGGVGKDACQGDSGGGAVSRGKVVGLSAFGFGCGRNIPGVYINLTEKNIRGWIHRYTGV